MRAFIVFIVLILFVQIFLLGFHTVITPSMEDTLLVGDRFVTLKFWYGLRLPIVEKLVIRGKKPARDDILIFRYPIQPKEVHVKRCIAVGGQTVEIVRKKLFVDSLEIALPHGVKHADETVFKKDISGKGKRDYFGPVTVPDSTIFVMGDNRDFSLDSRLWGFLPVDNIRGKAWLILWSTDPEVSWKNVKKKIRWNRMFKLVDKK